VGKDLNMKTPFIAIEKWFEIKTEPFFKILMNLRKNIIFEN